MADLVSLYDKPILKKTNFIAAWPGMGKVATVVVNYLKDKLEAKLLGEIPPGNFFAPTDAVVKNQVIKLPETPKNQFFYYKSAKSQGDVLFFLGSVQPIPHMEYGFAMEILKFARSFGAKMIYTTAAAPSDMDFQDDPRVFAVPNNKELLRKLMEYKVHFMSEGIIAGLNGLLISIGGEMGMNGVCLLGEIPFYTAQLEYPRAALKVLQVLVKFLGVDVDTVDLQLYISQKEKEIAPVASMLMKGGGSGKREEEDAEDEKEKEILNVKEKVPKTVLIKIEKLFRQAEIDQTYKSKMILKEELDKWGIFDDFLDRFLDLFKKS